MNNAFGSRTAGTDSLPEQLNRLEKEQPMLRAERLGEGERAISLLRFITCGPIGGGKSTLTGRMLENSKVTQDLARHGTGDADLDFDPLRHNLHAEPEQNITANVACRLFSTARRSFVVADIQGHEQFTRNMVTGASVAQLAVILVDASKSVLVQTRRHLLICSLLGIRHVAQ